MATANTQIASVVLLLGALVAGCISMSTTYWAGHIGSKTGKTVGLWQACEYIEGRTLECFRVMGLKFYETENERLDWFKAVQALYTLCLLCLIVSLVCCWASICIRGNAISLTKAAIYLSIISVGFCTLSLIIFGVKTIPTIRFYLTSSSEPMWSFYLALGCGCLQVFALPCMVLALYAINEGQPLDKQGPLLVSRSRTTLGTRSHHGSTWSGI